MAPKNRLNLNKKQPANASDASQAASPIDFELNKLVTLQTIAGALEGIAVELSDIKDNYNRELIAKNLLTEEDIADREAEEDSSDYEQ